MKIDLSYVSDLQKNIIYYNLTGYDISLCSGKNCNKKFLCFRYLAEPCGRQDYLIINLPENCSEFWDSKTQFTPVINKKYIETDAYFLSQLNLSYSELIWLYSEMKLNIEQLKNSSLVKKESNMIYIDFQKPTESEIRNTAYFTSKFKKYSLFELHWLLAEQQLLFKILIKQIFIKNQVKI